jgi:hypothetical protein
LTEGAAIQVSCSRLCDLSASITEPIHAHGNESVLMRREEMKDVIQNGTIWHYVDSWK